jgi:hypothetical protein
MAQVNRRVIDLYRDLYRAANKVTSKASTNPHLFRKYIRHKFEQARHETDAKKIKELINVGRDFLVWKSAITEQQVRFWFCFLFCFVSIFNTGIRFTNG